MIPEPPSYVDTARNLMRNPEYAMQVLEILAGGHREYVVHKLSRSKSEDVNVGSVIDFLRELADTLAQSQSGRRG